MIGVLNILLSGDEQTRRNRDSALALTPTESLTLSGLIFSAVEKRIVGHLVR